MSKNNSRKWKFIFLLVVSSLIILAIWFYFLEPLRRTRLYGEEMATAVEYFRETEFALATRLQPSLILSVSTEDYLPTFLSLNEVEMCEQCDRFWITTSVEVKRLRVLDYSTTQSRVRAEVVEHGYRVYAGTHERVTLNDVTHSDTVTYVFLRDEQASQWKLNKTLDYENPDLMNPNEVKLDDFLLFDWEKIQSD